MEKIIINEHIIQYRMIETHHRVTYYTSAFLLHEDGKGILVDAGYYALGEMIKKDIEKSNIELEYVIVSHYHKDHAEGSLVFDVPIIGSDLYETNMSRTNGFSKYSYKKPDVLVKDYLEISLNTSKVEIYKTPGHTPCGLSVVINDEFLYVSDNLLEDVDGKVIIPFFDVTCNPNDLYRSILMYDSLDVKHLLFSHGPVKLNANLNFEYSERLFYLESLMNSDFTCDLEDCLIRNKDNYSLTMIHKSNRRNGKKRMSIQPTRIIES